MSLLKVQEGQQLSLGFGAQSQAEAIFNKFKKLNPTAKKGKNGNTHLTYERGTGYLTFVVDKQGKPVAAMFDEDRVHDFLQHMKEKGFGPDIFATLSRISKPEQKGYTTIVKFN